MRDRSSHTPAAHDPYNYLYLASTRHPSFERALWRSARNLEPGDIFRLPALVADKVVMRNRLRLELRGAPPVAQLADQARQVALSVPMHNLRLLAGLPKREAQALRKAG